MYVCLCMRVCVYNYSCPVKLFYVYWLYALKLYVFISSFNALSFNKKTKVMYND